MKKLSELLEEFQQQESLKRFRNAVRQHMPKSKEFLKEQLKLASDFLVENIREIGLIRGYRSVRIKKLITATFDYQNKFGVSYDIEMRKEPEPSAVAFVAHQYGSLVSQLSQELEMTTELLERVKRFGLYESGRIEGYAEGHLAGYAKAEEEFNNNSEED